METIVEKPSKKQYIALLCIFFITGIMSLIELPVPPGRDQGIFLYHGWALFEGLTPYADMWDHKPPFIYLIYGMAVKIFGHRYVSINIMDIFWRLGTLIVVYKLATRVYGKREGLVAAAVYGIWSAAVGSAYWWTAQAEGFMALPLALAVYYYLKDRMDAHILCGIMIALAGMLKTTAILMFVMILIAILVVPRKTWEPYPKRAKFLSFLFGNLVVLIPVTLYFALSFAIDDVWNTVFTFNLYHSGVNVPFEKFWNKFRYLFTFFPPFWIVVWVKSLYSEEERRRHTGLVTAWLLVSFLMVLIQRKYFLYHYFVAIVPAALLAARGMGIIADYAKGRAGKALRVAVVAAAAIWICFSAYGWIGFVYVSNVVHYRSIEFMTGKIDKGTYFGRFGDPRGDTNLIEDRAVAAYVRDRTKPDETFLVWGFEPLVNFWAVRKAPNRFNSDYPLTFEPDSEVTKKLREKWRKDFIEEMESNPPVYIAVVHNDVNALEKTDSAAQLEKFPEFKDFMGRKYEIETTIKDFDIYRRK